MNPEYDNLSIRDKIEARMNTLQMQMEANEHITNPDLPLANILNLIKFWAALSEEDRDYIQAAQHALTAKTPWIA